MKSIEIRSQKKWYWRVDYLGWSLACAIAWAVIWILVAALASTNTVHTFGYVFLGWAIGWGMATLARAFYPAPKRTLLTRERRDQAPGRGLRSRLWRTRCRSGSGPAPRVPTDPAGE